MSRWERGGYTPTRKKPPPEHGIKVKKLGSTWWGQRWIEALEHVLRGHAGRLARGRTYARAGRTHDLVVARGKVTGKVTGSRATPYATTLTIGRLSDAVWTKAIAGMVAKAQFSAELLSGQMPREIDEVFRAAGHSLFPAQRGDIVTACSCPDWGDPCKHVAATHYVLGEAFDRDPFLLFELRGRTKEQVLMALRAARGEGETKKATQGRSAPVATGMTKDAATTPLVPAVPLGRMSAEDYERPRADLPAIHFAFDAPRTHDAVLRQLGVPGAWMGAASPADTLGPLVRAAAEHARHIAMADAAPRGGATEDAPTRSLRPAKAPPRTTVKVARDSRRGGA